MQICWLDMEWIESGWRIITSFLLFYPRTLSFECRLTLIQFVVKVGTMIRKKFKNLYHFIPLFSNPMSYVSIVKKRVKVPYNIKECFWNGLNYKCRKCTIPNALESIYTLDPDSPTRGRRRKTMERKAICEG